MVRTTKMRKAVKIFIQKYSQTIIQTRLFKFVVSAITGLRVRVFLCSSINYVFVLHCNHCM